MKKSTSEPMVLVMISNHSIRILIKVKHHKGDNNAF